VPTRGPTTYAARHSSTPASNHPEARTELTDGTAIERLTCKNLTSE